MFRIVLLFLLCFVFLLAASQEEVFDEETLQILAEMIKVKSIKFYHV